MLKSRRLITGLSVEKRKSKSRSIVSLCTVELRREGWGTIAWLSFQYCCRYTILIAARYPEKGDVLEKKKIRGAAL